MLTNPCPMRRRRHFMLPELQWTDLIPSDLSVAVRERDAAVDGNVSAHELEILSKLVKLTDPARLFEIGTFDGRTTLNLAAQSRPRPAVIPSILPGPGLAPPGCPLPYTNGRTWNKPQPGVGSPAPMWNPR